MIDLDRPPVLDRELTDPVGLRRSTLTAARRATGHRRRSHAVVAVTLVAATLLSAVLFGVLRQVAPIPQVAGPNPSATAAVGADGLDTDRGPATAAQRRAATRRCVSYYRLAAVTHVPLARRVDDGTGETIALVLQLADGRSVHCRPVPVTVLGGEVAEIEPRADRPAVVVGGVDSHDGQGNGTTFTERTAAVLRVTGDVARVDVVASGPGWTGRRFRGVPYEGWVYVPAVVTRPVPPQTPAPDRSGRIRTGGIKWERHDDPTLVVTAYDASGRMLFEQDY